MATALCTVDSEIALSGSTDGNIVLTKIKPPMTSTKVHAHTQAVTAVDAWLDCVVSAGADQMLNVYRRMYMSLVLIASERMPSTPTSIKLVKVGNRRCVMVGCKGLTTVGYYTIESLMLLQSFDFHPSGHGPESFTHLEIGLNKTRTEYAIATNDTPNLRLISGDVGSLSFSSVIVEGAMQNEHSLPKLSWSRQGPYVWLAGVDQFVRQVRTEDGVVVRKLDAKMGLMRLILAMEQDDYELVMAVSDAGTKRWQVSYL